MPAGAEAWFIICENSSTATALEVGAVGAGIDTLAAPLRDVLGYSLDTDMADLPISPLTTFGKKRPREEDEDAEVVADWSARFEKKARPTSADSASWPQDSVLNTPRSMSNAYQERKYDSDDQSSMVSKPGSPQDIAMSDDDMIGDDDDPTLFSQSPEDHRFGPRLPQGLAQARRDRIPTPIQPPLRPGARPIQQVFSDRNGIRQHVRLRHPPKQDPSSSSAGERLEVPSPIDEDEVPTPPSAAEAAGSQLSMLSVNDMDVEPPNTEEDYGLVRLPSISLSASGGLSLGEQVQRRLAASPVESDLMDSGEVEQGLTVRKQRQRSGALSHGGSPSPVRAPIQTEEALEYGGPPKRGFSMGFRADCEKCRMRVPGHMNHFVS